jgi:hypothetical protein
VIPLHVVAGFLESDRGIRDSGVLGKYGIMRDRAVISKERDTRGMKHQKKEGLASIDRVHGYLASWRTLGTWNRVEVCISDHYSAFERQMPVLYLAAACSSHRWVLVVIGVCCLR